MNRQIQDSNAFLSIQEKLADIIDIIYQIQDYLKSKRPASIPASVYEGISRLTGSIPNLTKEIKDLEGERKDYRILSQIGQVVNSSLDIDGVLQIVMDTIIRLTEAERGFFDVERGQRGIINPYCQKLGAGINRTGGVRHQPYGNSASC